MLWRVCIGYRETFEIEETRELVEIEPDMSQKFNVPWCVQPWFDTLDAV